MIQKTATLYRNAYGGMSREIWLLAAVMLINRSGTMVIPFMSVYLTQSLHFTLSDAGLVVSCAGAGGILGVYLGGKLTDKLGHYYVQLFSLALGGMTFFVLMHMRTIPTLCATAFFLNLVGEGFRPANSTSIAFYSTPENRTRAYALNRLAINVGWAIGPALGGIFATIGYKYLFIADGITNVSAALFLLFLVKNRNSATEEQKHTEQEVPITQSAFRDGVFMRMLAFTVLFAICFMTFFSIVPVFWRSELKIKEVYIGLLLGMNGVLVAAVEMLLIYRIERLRSKLTFIGWGVLLCSLAYLFFVLFPGMVWILPVAVVTITFSEMLAMPFLNSLTIERSTPQNRGQYSALYSMCYSVAQVTAPILGGQIATRFGFYTLWGVLVGVSVVSYLGFRWVESLTEERSRVLS
ncbi:MAG TPA: MFS transporter [Runella sp.]|nr:MFS transporter [Runella sp.]HAO49235.1 MFS transporter [Runella sp.]